MVKRIDFVVISVVRNVEDDSFGICRFSTDLISFAFSSSAGPRKTTDLSFPPFSSFRSVFDPHESEVK